MPGNFVGPPLLKEFSCEVKADTSDNNKVSTPMVFLQLKIDDNSALTENLTKTVSMELDSNGLDAVLDGLHRIQNQLSNVSNKQSRS